MKRFLFLSFLTLSFLFICSPITAQEKDYLIINLGPEDDKEWMDDYSGIFIVFYFSPLGEMVMTDPLGRKLGFDPIKEKEYEEIPNSSYAVYPDEDCETGEILGDPRTILMIVRPVEGEYQLEVIGIGRGNYTLTIALDDKESNQTKEIHEKIPISPGTIHTYKFMFKK